MDKENKALIFLMLDPRWKEKHKGGRPAIPLFVRDLRVAYPGTEVLQQDEESCTLSVVCGEDSSQRVEDRVSALLQNAVGTGDHFLGCDHGTSLLCMVSIAKEVSHKSDRNANTKSCRDATAFAYSYCSSIFA